MPRHRVQEPVVRTTVEVPVTVAVEPALQAVSVLVAEVLVQVAVLVVWELKHERMARAPAVQVALVVDPDLDLGLNLDLEEPEVSRQEEVGAAALGVAVLLLVGEGLTMATMEVGWGAVAPQKRTRSCTLLQPDRKFIPY